MPSTTLRRFRAFAARDLDRLLDRYGADAETKLLTKAVAAVLPFKTNEYVVDELIDWDRVPDDPIFRMVFPQPGMLRPDELDRMAALVRAGADADTLTAAAREIQRHLNAHPAGQTDLNAVRWNGRPIAGVQHKYRETLLLFPRQGQTCHTYCAYCFRWAQFVGVPEIKIATDAHTSADLVGYLGDHPEVTDVLLTGGDPMIMSAETLRRVVEPLLDPRLESIRSIRIGTKAFTYWPARFTDDPDADELMRLFERIRGAGKHLALMAHVTHPRELEPEPVDRAFRRVRAAGAVIRTQAPLLRGINDDADVWRRMWQHTVELDAVPYYMFVERDTGPRQFFEVPLGRAWEIYRQAIASVSGLARTARGPSMSATAGKVVIDSVTDIGGRQAFALRYLQARDPELVGRTFFADYDPHAVWISDLRPLAATDAPLLDPDSGMATA